MTIRLVLPGCRTALLAALLLLPAGRLTAQTSTGSLRGVVADSAGAPIAGAEVVALSTTTGIQRAATSNARGFYSLAGLSPAPYQITVRHIGHTPVQRPVTLQVGQTLTLDFRLAATTVQLEEVVVQAAPAPETQTSEVATNVTQAQIQNLPSSSRNFLDLAALAPSVRVSADRINGTDKTFSSGASPAENINVFVDGQSYKNDIIGGGVAGQDDSRGNPFPRNAVQEFRIITNNFKAEYQKASSAIITAVTRSGGNEWQGSVFGSLQNKALVALDTFARRDQALDPGGFTEPDYSRVLAGGSLGGPLIRDRLFLFASYEGNFQNRQGVTRFRGDSDIWPPELVALEGDRNTAPFRSHLGFAKLTYNLNQQQMVEVSGNLRIERDRRRFGGQLGSSPDRAFEAGENFRNNVVDGSVKHTYFGDNWTNEALAYYQWYQYRPEPLNPNLIGREFRDLGRIGGSENDQDLVQKRLAFRDDWTYSGFQAGGSHVIKLGATAEFLRYDLTKRLNENPRFIFSASNGFAFPDEAFYGTGDPEVSGTNAQLGLYVQDDWSPTPRLTINAGIRWDYESGMYNRDFVTPVPVRDSILALRDQLFLDIDPNRYFTDGDDREAFTGAFQPRLGFSYALDEDRRTTVFAAAGIFYDRLGFNTFFDETYRRQHPNFNFFFTADGANGTIQWDPSLLSKQGLDSILALGQAPPQEVFLIPNDLRPPKTYQWNVGVRQVFGSVLASVAYTGSRGRNGFTYEWANVMLDPARDDCCITVPLTSYQNILVGNNSVRSWYDALEFRIDRSYRPSETFGWGAGVAYTLSWAEREGGDLFSFPQVGTILTSRRPIADDQRHAIVANWVTDVPFAFGVQFSGLVTLASGKPFNVLRFVPLPGGAGNQRVLEGMQRTGWFKNVDMRVRKDFPGFGGTRLGVTGDVFNVFNSDNLGCLVEDAGNSDFGNATCIVADPRRFQLGVQYDF